MTILEIIQRSSDFLAKKGVESPRLQIELMLCHVLSLPRMQLYLNFERQLTAEQVDTLRGFVQRRGNREPLQYILGTTCFCGLDLTVNKHVLIPRPETEILAERGWTYLQSLGEGKTALDFGTGSGCLAITLAAHCPKAQIHALDISADALSVVRGNAEKNKVSIQFHHGDGFAALSQDLRFDLIVANPPYIPDTEIETLEPEVRDFEPRAALSGGGDGLDFFRRMATEAPRFLQPNAPIMLEFSDGQSPAIRAIFEQQNWVVEAVEPDYTQRLRIFIARYNQK